LIESACDGALPRDDLDSVVDQLLEVSRPSIPGLADYADVQTIENDMSGAMAPPVPTPGSVTWMST